MLSIYFYIAELREGNVISMFLKFIQEFVLPLLTIQNVEVAALACWTWYKFHKQNTINEQINKEKAELQKQVNQMVEQQKFENQKKLTEFNLYTEKKHERCIDLYEKINDAIVQVDYQAQRFHRKVRTFEDYGENDVKQFLDSIPITEKERKRILDVWNHSHHEGCRELQRLETRVRSAAMENSLVDASEAFLKARLYLPKEFARDIAKYIEDLGAFANDMAEWNGIRENAKMINCKDVYKGIHEELKNRSLKAKQFIDEFEEIIDKLQNELKG